MFEHLFFTYLPVPLSVYLYLDTLFDDFIDHLKTKHVIKAVLVLVKIEDVIIPKLYVRFENGEFGQYIFEGEKLYPNFLSEDIMLRLNHGEEFPFKEYKFT